MKRRVEEAVSPWEHVHDEQALLHLEIAPQHKKQEEKHEDLAKHEEKAVVVHALHPQPLSKPQEKRQRKHSVQVLAKPKCNNIQQYINRLEEKAVQDKLKPHFQQKRLEVAVKPIAKNDLTIHLPLDACNHNKIAIERPIKHMPKSSRDAPVQQERHEFKDLKGEMREFGIKYQSRKHSMDNLQRHSKYEAALKKTQEHEEQIIKKCALKNIQIYQQEKHAHQEKELKRSETVRKTKPNQKRHILDRILSKFQ